NYNNRTGTLLGDGFRESTEKPTLQKIEWIREGAGNRFAQLEIHIGAYFTEVTDDAIGAAAGLSEMFGVPSPDVMSHPHALIGTPEASWEELVRRREMYGISYVSVGAHLIDEFAPVVERLSGT